MFNFFRRKKTVENRDFNLQQMRVMVGSNYNTASGVTVNETTALKLSVLHVCVKIIAESIASMPLVLYRKAGRSTEPAIDHPLYHVMAHQPNHSMTSYEMREVIQGHLGLTGNGYGYVRRVDGAVESVTPLYSPAVRSFIDRSGSIHYEYQPEHGDKTVIQSENMLHIKYFSPTGLIGYSPIQLAAESIGMTRAVDEYAGRFFANDATPSGVLEHPGKLSDTAFDHLKNSWIEAHQGKNQHKPAILEEGMKWAAINKNPSESQLIDVRKFNVIDICRVYRIPPHMVAELDRSTNNNIEHQGIEFIVHTLTPWMVRWEQAMNKTLLTDSEIRDGYYFKFNDRRLLRGDSQGRAEYYSKMVNIGGYTINEVRALEDMNPIHGGDEPMMQINMAPLSRIITGDPGGDQQKGGDNADVSRSLCLCGSEHDTLQNCGHIESRSDDTTDAETISAIRAIQDAHYDDILNAADGLVDSETSDILNAINSGKLTDPEVFINTWISDFYTKMPDRVRSKMRHVLWDYQDAIHNHAKKMIGAGKLPSGREFLKFKKSYIDSLADRYTESSIGQIRALLDPMDPESFLAYLTTRLEEWGETRADKLARNERVRAAFSAARDTWKSNGVKKLRWITNGSENCPYCRLLNGKIVGIEQHFLQDGDVLTATDDSGNWMKMKIYGSKRHPPIHGGCDCAVVPA